LIAGFGVGWSPDEFEAVGVSLSERGARLDECLDVLEVLWTTDPAQYHGRYWTLPATRASIKPVQRPHPPVFLAGHTPAAMRRVRVDEIAETIVRAGKEAAVDHAFVELMYLAKSVDHALELAERILALVRTG
jgi:alkanesulfonate monooxygenase SsuD/methylene tetrahydromethanopterin reductase-like flavin-dependent oxidoreductase (luciferase family)